MNTRKRNKIKARNMVAALKYRKARVQYSIIFNKVGSAIRAMAKVIHAAFNNDSKFRKLVNDIKGV